MDDNKLRITPEGPDRQATVALPRATNRFIVLGNLMQRDVVHLRYEDIPEFVRALTTLYKKPTAEEPFPEPLSKAEFMKQLMTVFPSVDAFPASKVYFDDELEQVWSTNTSRIGGQPAYDLGRNSDGYINGIHVDLRDWVNKVGWQAIRQAKGCLFFPRYHPL